MKLLFWKSVAATAERRPAQEPARFRGGWILAAALMGLSVTVALGAKKGEDISPSAPAEAYFALVRGDTARENGNFAAALAAYQDALARYEQIAQAHPDWESDIVQYRIVYCRQQIEEVQKQMTAAGEEAAAVSQTEPPAAASAPATEEAAGAKADEDVEQTADAESPEPGPAATETTEELAAAADASRESQETEYLRNRIAELLHQVSELEEALETQTEAGDVGLLKQQLDEMTKRAESAEAKVRDLEDEVRRLSRVLAETQEKSGPSEKSEAGEYRALLREAMKRERARDFRGALALYEQARKKKGADGDAVLGQGRCLIALGQLDKALAFLEKQKDAENASDVVVLRATALGALGRYEQVVSLLEPLRERGASEAWVFNLLGAAQLALGRYDEARASLDKAIELAPDFPEPYYNLAVWYLTATNDAAKARELYQQSVKLGGPAEPAFDNAGAP
jgi:tetratricopeptide (TPR) repeat protein